MTTESYDFKDDKYPAREGAFLSKVNWVFIKRFTYRCCGWNTAKGFQPSAAKKDYTNQFTKTTFILMKILFQDQFNSTIWKLWSMRNPTEQLSIKHRSNCSYSLKIYEKIFFKVINNTYHFLTKNPIKVRFLNIL